MNNQIPEHFCWKMLLSRRGRRLIGMGLIVTPLETPRRFNPLAQPLEAAQKLGGRELVWRFDGGDITSDGGALVLKRLEERTGILRRFAACFTDYRKADQIEHPLGQGHSSFPVHRFDRLLRPASLTTRSAMKSSMAPADSSTGSE